MSIVYRYKCTLEDALVYETRSEDAPVPTVCVNDGALIVPGSLAIYDRPESLDDLNVEPSGVIDFNGCTVEGLSHDALENSGTRTHGELDAHVDNDALHRVIDDTATGTTHLWSASKIASELSAHTHVASDVTNFQASVSANTQVSENTTHRGRVDNPHSVTAAQVGAITGATNLAGGDQGLNAGVSGTQLQLKTLKAGDNVTLTADANAVTIHSAAAGLVWRGTWTNSSYAVGDAVEYNGSAYICIADTTNEVPTDTGFWDVLASKGDTGPVSGPTHPSGAPVLDKEVVVFDGTGGESIAGSGRRDYGPSASDPASPTPQAGDRYYNTTINHEMYYDGVRGKWLSLATLMDGAGINGRTRDGDFFRRWNGMPMSATRGPYVQKGTIVRIGYTMSSAENIIYDVLVNGSVVASLPSNGAASASDDTFNADFEEGTMASRNRAGGDDAWYLQSVIYYKLRA